MSKRLVGDLEDQIVHLECMAFSVGYRDGVADLMAALTFNKLNIQVSSITKLHK